MAGNPIGNLLGKVNASNALVVTLDGGTASATAFYAGDGTSALPSYSFTNYPTQGLYSPALGTIYLDFNGTVFAFTNAAELVLDAVGALKWGSSGVATPDLSVVRGAAGRADLASALRLVPVAFASLPTAAEGAIASVNDSSTNVWGATIAGGGANKVLAYYNGTNWTVAAK